MSIITIDLETGDLSKFDYTLTDGGDLSVEAAAAAHGAYGLQCNIDDTNQLKAYVNAQTDTLHPALATGVEFWMREYFKIDSAYTIPSNNSHLIHEFNSRGDNVSLFYTHFCYDYAGDGNYRLATRVAADSSFYLGGSSSTGPILSKGVWHCLEYHWKRSSADNANDAEVDMWIDGSLIQHVEGIDIWRGVGNGVGPVRIRISSVDAGTSGKLYFDDLVISDEGRIYPMKCRRRDNGNRLIF